MSLIRKTKTMIAVEKRLGRPLEILIPEALGASVRDQDAAGALGILPTTLSHWISRLQLHNEADDARLKRLDNSNAA